MTSLQKAITVSENAILWLQWTLLRKMSDTRYLEAHVLSCYYIREYHTRSKDIIFIREYYPKFRAFCKNNKMCREDQEKNPTVKSVFSSVRSSYSHPDLLLTPLFEITPVLNTGLSLSEPLQLYKGYNAKWRQSLDSMCWLHGCLMGSTGHH